MISATMTNVNLTSRSHSLTSTAIKSYKLVVLGSGGVGKSSLVSQFLNGLFPDNYQPTVEDSYRHLLQLPNGVFQNIEILDTAGLHQFPAMRQLGISSGQAFVVVYAIDDEYSYQNALDLLDLIIDKKGYEHIPIVLVGNKQDLEDQRQVQTEDACVAAEERNCTFLESCAKCKTEVQKIFMELLFKAFGVNKRLEKIEREKFIRKFSRKFRPGLLPRRNSDEGNNNVDNSKCVIS